MTTTSSDATVLEIPHLGGDASATVRSRVRVVSPCRSWGIPVALAVLLAAAFLPDLGNRFVRWDDAVLFDDNPRYRGLGWKELRWMFSTFTMGHWVPVTWLTHGLDYTLWGMNPLGYHLTNVTLHALNAALFYLVARRLLGRAMRLDGAALPLAAATAALFFAVHPLRAESVAWATEPPDVLSGCLFFLPLRAPDATPAEPRRLRICSIACFVLAFLSKSIVMTLPLVLVLLDFYPLRRLPWQWRAWLGPESRAVWREKIPYVAVSLAGGLV